jgi:hypothetical protein
MQSVEARNEMKNNKNENEKERKIEHTWLVASD